MSTQKSKRPKSVARSQWIVLVDSHGPPEGDFGDIAFLPFAPGARGDGYLAYHAPTPQLLEFDGPRAWFSTEPITHRTFRSKAYLRYERHREQFSFLHHSPRADAFVPMLTHYSLQPQFREANARTDAVVAVVSNHGGRYWRLKPGESLRNRFLLSNEVHLFGSDAAWAAFRRWPWSPAAVPANYRGNWTSSYLEAAHIAQLSTYRVSLCLENSVTSYYFSEKLINAARAGCIPIYQAHPSVRAAYLEGAVFVDPANYNLDPVATVKAALAMDREEVAARNFRWLESQAVQSTGHRAIWTKIAEHFSRQFNNR
jgi:hypothetical protein